MSADSVLSMHPSVPADDIVRQVLNSTRHDIATGSVPLPRLFGVLEGFLQATAISPEASGASQAHAYGQLPSATCARFFVSKVYMLEQLTKTYHSSSAPDQEAYDALMICFRELKAFIDYAWKSGAPHWIRPTMTSPAFAHRIITALTRTEMTLERGRFHNLEELPQNPHPKPVTTAQVIECISAPLSS